MFNLGNLNAIVGSTITAGFNNKRRYYVDFTAGADTNTGRSPTAPWKTMTKVNAFTGFLFGDQILFKCGETWAGIQLVVSRSGLNFGSYGAGAKPIIDGSDTVDCVSGNGKNNLTFTNIEVTQGLDFGFVFSSENSIVLNGCEAHDCGNDQLLFTNCTNCNVIGGKYYNAYTRVNDDRFITGIEVMDTCHDITIDGAELYGNIGVAAPAHYGAGISIHAHAGSVMSYNITVKNCNIHNQGLNNFGIRVNYLNNATMTNRNIIIENNIIVDGAYGGIQVNSAIGVAFPVVGVIVRNNIIKNNAGNWGLAVVNQDTCLVHHNLITNNNDSQAAQCLTAVNCTNTGLYNNTTYNLFNNFWYSLYLEGATTANLSVRNNIIGGAVANMMGAYVKALTGVTGLVIDYNLYQYAGAGNRFTWLGTAGSYTTWKTANSNDANSPARGDPLFTNPGAGIFTLQAGSPAINAGVIIPGITDGYLGVAPDCGAYEKV